MNTKKILVELPCKVGDHVWIDIVLTPRCSELVECKVVNFVVKESMKIFAVMKRLRPKGFDSVYIVSVDDFSRYVVSAKEQAKNLWKKQKKESKETTFPSIL